MIDRGQILEEFGEFIYVADVDTYDLLYMNEHAMKILNTDSETYRQYKCYELIQGLDTPCPFCTNKYLSYDQIYVWEFKNPFLRRHFSIRDKLIKWEGRTARLELSFDVTDYKREVETLEDQISSMVQSIPGGICQVADDGLLTILWHNDAFLNLIGYTVEQFKTELNNAASYIIPEDMAAVAGALEAAKQTRQTQTLEMRIKRRDGEALTLLTTLSYTPSTEGAPCPSFYSVVVNITEYKRLLERNEREVKDALLAKAEAASQSKSRFLSRMSHELRTPLNAVIGMNRLAIQSSEDKHVLRGCHEKIESAAQYLLSLINDVLDFSRIESGKLHLAMQVFSLPTFLYDLYDMFADTAEQRRLHFSLQVEPFEEEQFTGDALHLKQIFVNLLSNAFKFTGQHGDVSLKVRKLTRRSRITVLEFTISDTGIGIPADGLTRIFNLFEQGNGDIANRYGGSGLGLTITKSLVELMDGTITAQSKEGEGSSFTVILPLATELEAHPWECPKEGSLRVLVADETDGQAAVRILEAAGIGATHASDGAQAVLLLDASLSGREPFDAVLLAEEFPGADLIRDHLRRPELADVGLLSTGTHPSSIASTGPSVFIRKPFFRSTLLKGLSELYEHKPKEASQKAPFDFTGKRLLLVEDNELNMEIATELLKGYGFAIVPACNGQEALTLFAASPPRHFDAVLMDVLMPVLDGLGATRKIRRLEREDARTVPIIALSANAFEEDRQKSLDSGMNAHVSKPLDLDALCRLLESFFQKEAPDEKGPRREKA